MENILDLIGSTPLVRINKLNKNKRVDLYVKLEKLNPGGSVKDRVAKYMLECAEREGELTHDRTVIEPTSGNTGIGLALVCAAKGYDLTLVMPETATRERKKMLIAYGAKIVLSEGSKGMDGAQDLAEEIVNKEPEKYFMPNQFANRCNPLAHYETTGEEIWRDTEGKITHFVAGIGTTGTLMGVSQKLKEKNPEVKVIGVMPEEDTPIPGLKNLDVQYVPDIWNPEAIDEIVKVTVDEAEEMARALALGEGIFCGPSSGAIFKIALEKTHDLRRGTVVAILPDGGERYLSTALCDPDKCYQCRKKYHTSCVFGGEIYEE